MLHKESQSLMDLLLRVMPDLKNRLMTNMQKATPQSAKTLYSIWQSEADRIAEKKFRRPQGISRGDVQRLETEGLVQAESMGDTVVFTKKGGEVLRQMILGDERSTFDASSNYTYHTALANLNPSRRRLGVRTACLRGHELGSNWYSQLKESHGT